MAHFHSDVKSFRIHKSFAFVCCKLEHKKADARYYLAPAWKTTSRLLQHCSVESLPVVEVVEIDSVTRSIGNTVGAEDFFAGAVVMDVTNDRAVELVDRSLVELHAGLALDPCFELRIGRLAGLDVIQDRVAI